jgi:two-component system chemotaxis sensor kinase CheA
MNDDASSEATAASLMLEAIDRMRLILAGLAVGHDQPLGDDTDLITRFEAATRTSTASRSGCRSESIVLETPISAVSAPPERRIETVCVSSKSIERMAALVSDLVVTRNQLFGATADAAFDPIRIPLQRLSNIAAELQSGVMAAQAEELRSMR